MDWTWVKIVSWHAVRLTRSIEPRTLCGRVASADAPTSPNLPGGEKSCESCLRLTVYRTEGQ